MSVSDRLITKYNAVSYPNESCGQHDTVESAIFAIEKKQKEIYDSLIEYDLVTLDT